MVFNRFSLNALLISIFISNVSCLESENKTTFYNSNDKSFIQNLLRDSLLKKDFEVNNNNNNQSFNDSFLKNNQTLSEILLKKNSNDSQSNPSLILKQLIEEIHKNDPNVSVSESRTLSSWLGLNRLRKPQFKIKPFQGTVPKQDHSLSVPPIVPPALPFPQFMSRPPSFPGPHDPESILLPPNLFEETGIKYWLKFIENGGKYESQASEEYESRPVVTKSSARKRRPHYSSNSGHKPIDIGEKPNDDNNDDYYEEEENDDQNHNHHQYEEDENDKNDEPKSSGSTSSNGKQTFDTSPRCDKFTSDICVDDFEYPEQAIVDEIYKRREIFELMYSEVRDNLPLVDGIPRDVEESYNYDYYDDNKDPHTSSSGGAEKKSSHGKGFVCPSEVMYGKPKLARNKRGDWKVIVNAAEFTQTVRMEKCLKPNSKCNYISSGAYGDLDSRCAQVHSYHRLLVFEKGKGFYIDTFRMPTACTCHITRRVSYKPSSSSHSTGFHKKKKKPSSPPLSNTLWSILGGPPPGDGPSMSQSQDMIRNQINLLNQLKHFPQLSHITPDNVFQQLMDFQPNSGGMLSSGYSPQKTFQNPQKSSLDFGQSSGIDYILPSLMFNEDQTNNDRKTHSHHSRPFAQIQQTPGTTTVLNPNGNGAPVVQVIHVPVTSAVAHNPDPAPVYKGKHPSFNDYTYLDASSLFYKPKPNSDEFMQTFGDDFSQLSVNNFKPLMLGMSSKTNSSLMSPNAEKDPIKRESETVATKNNSDSDETNKKRKVMVENTLNKKINFSYHPILEYISN